MPKKNPSSTLIIMRHPGDEVLTYAHTNTLPQSQLAHNSEVEVECFGDSELTDINTVFFVKRKFDGSDDKTKKLSQLYFAALGKEELHVQNSMYDANGKEIPIDDFKVALPPAVMEAAKQAMSRARKDESTFERAAVAIDQFRWQMVKLASDREISAEDAQQLINRAAKIAPESPTEKSRNR